MHLPLLAKKLTSALLMISVPFILFAQQKTITGKVTNEKDGSPLSGVSVIAKGDKTGTQTANDGTYSISVAASVTKLIFSYVGFTIQEISIGSNSTLDVVLASNSQGLEGIVVIGYGTARKKDLTGAVVSVKAKDFNQGIISSPDQLLAGKVSGLEITNNSGQPGAATTIKIRGNNSLRSDNSPLYVIDGVPLDGRTARPSLNLGSNGLSFGTTPETNPLLYINPYDIAEMNVLKDASAAAIYGSRGANGVIIITTRKGAANGIKLEVGTSFGFSAGYLRKFKVLTADEFRTVTKRNTLDFDSGSSVNALKSISQNSLTQNYNLSLSGGNENGRFRASFFGSKISGFIKKTSLARYIGSFNGQYKFLDKRLSLDFNLIAGHTTENMGLITNTAGAGGNLISYALNWNPTKAFKNSKGQYYLTSNSIPNPLAVIDGYNDEANVNVFLGNISAGVKILSNLEYKFLFALNHGTGVRNTNIDGWVDGLQGVTGLGFGGISHATLTSQTFTHTLNYNAKLTSKLNLDAIAGYEYWKTDFKNSTLAATQFNTNLNQDTRIPILYTSFMQNAKTQYPLTSGQDPTTEIQSFFARVNLNLADKYYLTGTMRADGSNKFGSNNKYGYFPSVGVRWLVSNENFMKNNKIFSSFALRASWGITGNQQFPAGAALEQVGSNSYNSAGQVNVPNPDLKWEKTTTFNIGLDYGILHNRINGSIDYYNKNTTNLLFQSVAIAPGPSAISFINIPANLINSGVEFSVNAAVVDKQSFSWDLSFNMAYNKNRVKNFNQAPIETAQISGQGVSAATAQRIVNDQPANVYYLKPFLGFDSSGQQIIGSTPEYAGDPNPAVILGFSNTLRYKKISLTINFGGAFGYKIYNNTYNTVTNISNIKAGKNVAASSFDTPESIGDGVVASTRYLENGNYLKLRNLKFEYNFGNMGKYIKNLNAFVSANNVFVITKFTGFDPEVNVDKNRNGYPSRNIEYIPYPTQRTISFGLNFGL
jgi:iron complex outermembrane receptor protein